VAVVTLAAEPLATRVPATGTLLPAEQTEIVSELSRKLVRVHARDGARVKRGAPLFQLDASDLSAELSLLAVQQSLAERTAARQKELLAERVTTEAEWEQAAAAVEELAARRRLLTVTLERTTVRAPFDGVLGLRRVSEGAWVTPQTVLITIADTSRLKLDFVVPERYAAALRAGVPFDAEVAGRPGTLRGTIDAVESSADVATRSLRVRGFLDAPEDLLPGAFARVYLPVTVPDALLVPAIALSPGPDGQALFVARGGRAERVVVELGVRTADRVQVVSGVSAGDQVIVTQLLRLRPGAAVQVDGGP
jgi:membrane fusion protein (multidrug efflux system)